MCKILRFMCTLNCMSNTQIWTIIVSQSSFWVKTVFHGSWWASSARLYTCFSIRQHCLVWTLCILPILSHRILKRYILRGPNLVRLIIPTASMRTFLSETGFLFQLQACDSDYYNDDYYSLVQVFWFMLRHQQFYWPLLLYPQCVSIIHVSRIALKIVLTLQ